MFYELEFETATQSDTWFFDNEDDAFIAVDDLISDGCEGEPVKYLSLMEIGESGGIRYHESIKAFFAERS